MVSFPRKRLQFCKENFEYIFSCLSKIPLYTTSMLLKIKESRNERISIVIQYLILHNAAKEMSNVMWLELYKRSSHVRAISQLEQALTLKI